MRYKMQVWEETGAYAYVTAKNKKEAVEKVQEHIEEYGVNEIGMAVRIDVTHHDNYLLTQPEEDKIMDV